MDTTTYTFFGDLAQEVEVPRDGILSRILLKNDAVNVTLFGFSAGQELTEHTASLPAIIQIVKGEARITLGGEQKEAGPDTWFYMPPQMPHSISAKTPLVMLLVLVKGGKGE